MRSVVRGPAAEISYQRYLESLPDSAQAYETAISTIAAAPQKGRLTAGGRREYLLAAKNMPAVRMLYTFDGDTVTISVIEAFPGAGDDAEEE